jgi:hypothetical protein
MLAIRPNGVREQELVMVGEMRVERSAQLIIFVALPG